MTHSQRNDALRHHIRATGIVSRDRAEICAVKRAQQHTSFGRVIIVGDGKLALQPVQPYHNASVKKR